MKRNLISKEGKLLDNNYYVFKKGELNKKIFLFDNDENNNNETRIGLREFNLLKNICHKNISRLFECIIDKNKNKIVFVMEFCDLGSLMKIKENEYEYNLILMKFLYEKIFKKNNEKIFEIDNFKPDNILFKSYDLNEEKNNYIKLSDFSNSLKFNDLNEKINCI